MNTTYGSKGEGIKNHSCFNGNSGVGVRTRQAVNYLVNRPAALAQRGAFAGTPTDQVLPPTMPGFKNWKLYPTGKPNATKAKSLKPKKCGNIVFYGSTSPISLGDHAAGQVRPVEDRDQREPEDVPLRSPDREGGPPR